MKKELILIESIGDMLSLWSAGIKNTLVIFGLNLSPSLIGALIKIDPKNGAAYYPLGIIYENIMEIDKALEGSIKPETADSLLELKKKMGMDK